MHTLLSPALYCKSPATLLFTFGIFWELAVNVDFSGRTLELRKKKLRRIKLGLDLPTRNLHQRAFSAAESAVVCTAALDN